MRVDKFLKVSRILKRRTVSKELADHDRIVVNGKIAKPSTKIKVNDLIEVTFGQRVIKVRVLQIVDHTKKEDAAMMYEVVEEA